MTPQPGEITVIRAGPEFHVCPACGYALGFHTSLVGMNADKDNPVKSTREVYRVILICPECGARYDVGWHISLSEPESTFVKATTIPLHSLVSPDAQSPNSPHVHVVTLDPSRPNRDQFLPE